MEWILSWEVTGVVVGLLIAVALAVLTLNDFRAAKIWFFLAALDASASILMWTVHSTWKDLTRIGVSLVALVFVLFLLIVAFRYADRKKIAKENEILPSPEGFAAVIIKNLAEANSKPLGIEESPIIPASDGFVQYEGRSIAIEKEDEMPRVAAGDVCVGEVIKVKFEIANRGPRPVFDNQSWGVIAFVDPAKNPGSKLREVMLQGITTGYEQFKNSGNDLGAGIQAFNFAQSTPVTKGELDGLKDGSLRIHVLLGGAWSDAIGRRFYWTRAEWTNWPQVPLAKSFWKDS